MTNGFSHYNHLDESTFILGESGVILNDYSFFYNFSLSKQNSPIWDAAFCGVTSGAMLFCLCPIKGTPGLNELSRILSM